MVYAILLIIIGILLVDKILANKFYKEAANNMVQEFRDTVLPCSLIVTINYNQPQENTITDFSKYEKLGIVGLTINCIKDAGENKDIDGKSHFYQEAVVWQFEGIWLWKTL